MGLKRLMRNLKFLMKYDLDMPEDYFVDALNNYWKKDASLMIDNLKYELEEDLKELYRPDIKTPFETVEELVNTQKSFARFGDGEFHIINNEKCVFDKPNEKLTQKLKDALLSDDPNLMIGLNYVYYHSLKTKSDVDKPISRCIYSECRKILEKYLRKDKTYYSAEITQMYIISNIDDWDAYFERVKDIWRNKDITIVCGDKVFDNIETNIFDCAKSIDYVYVPTVNASEKYDEIFEKIKKVSNKLIILICGPVATALAYDISSWGGGTIQALDMGHIAKDYDYYVNKRSREIESTRVFFGPEDKI